MNWKWVLSGRGFLLGILACFLLLTQASTPPACAQVASSQSPPSNEIPQIDAGLGPCWVEFMVEQPNEKPAQNAKITVHITYGFMGFHKLDLEAPTNREGKARFTGLPDKLKRGLLFRALEGDLEGTGFIDPAKNCRAQHTIALSRKTTEPQNP